MLELVRPVKRIHIDMLLMISCLRFSCLLPFLSSEISSKEEIVPERLHVFIKFFHAFRELTGSFLDIIGKGAIIQDNSSGIVVIVYLLDNLVELGRCLCGCFSGSL